MIALCVLTAGCAGGGRPAMPPAVVDGIPLAALPRQPLGQGQCGLFLWKAAPEARLVLVVNSGPPPRARIALAGRTVDLPRLDAAAAPLGGAAETRYGDGHVTAALSLVIEERRGLSDGALAHGSLRIERDDGDGFVLPVSGLLACG